MYCNLTWFILSITFLLMLILTSLKVLYSFLSRKYFNHIYLLGLFLLPSLLP
jgi:hypothetical protein